MDDFTGLIRAEGGDWHETEVLGNFAIVKVRGSVPTLALIANTAGFRRLPKDRLDDSLADLTAAQKQALRDRLLDMGYSVAEIQTALGNDLGTKMLRGVLRFAATRRRKPRYDAPTDTILLDGPVQPCRDVDDVDRAVP